MEVKCSVSVLMREQNGPRNVRGGKGRKAGGSGRNDRRRSHRRERRRRRRKMVVINKQNYRCRFIPMRFCFVCVFACVARVHTHRYTHTLTHTQKDSPDCQFQLFSFLSLSSIFLSINFTHIAFKWALNNRLKLTKVK